MNLNKVLLIGNLTKDPEIKKMTSGTQLANLRLAVNRQYTTSTGTKAEDVVFVDVEAWGKQAETIGKYLKKGRSVFIEGRLKLDEWTDKETNKVRSKILVVCENFQFLPDGGTKKVNNTSVTEETDVETDGGSEEYDNAMNKLASDDDAIKKAMKEFQKMTGAK